MSNARSKLDRGSRVPADGSTDEGAPRDLAELARKRAAAADIARRLAALKQVRAHPGAAPIWEPPADGVEPEAASPEVASAAGQSPDLQSPGAQAKQPRRGSDNPDPAARPHPLVQARAISDAARRQKAGQDFAGQDFAGQNFAGQNPANRTLDERAAREWAYDQPPQRRAVSVEPSLPAEDAAQSAFYGAAFSALLTNAAARPRLDIERPAPQPMEVAPQIAETVDADQVVDDEEPVADSTAAVAEWMPAARPEPNLADEAAEDRAARVTTDDEGHRPSAAQEVVADAAADDDAPDAPDSHAPLADEIAAAATPPMPDDAGHWPTVAQEADAQATDTAADAADDDASDAPDDQVPLESQIAAAAARVAQAAGDVTDDREPSLWAGRAPILVARPATRLAGDDAPDVHTADVGTADADGADAGGADVADDAAEEPAWRTWPEQPEATPYFHITELTQAPTRRRAHRAALLVGLAAIVGTAAGAAAILQSPLREQSDPVAVVSAAVGGSAMGRVAEMSAPDPQAAPDAADAPESLSQSAPGIAAPPQVIEPAPQIAVTPADAPPTEEAAPEPAQAPRALAKALRAPVPQISSATEIGAAPVTMPQMPAEPSAGQSTGATLAAPPEALPEAGGTPRVAAKLKPDPAQSHVVIEGAAENAAAKPFVPQAAANPAPPAAKPAAQAANKPQAAKPTAQPANKKAAKLTPEPIKGVLNLLAPFMNDSKPQETQWGTRK